MQALQIHAGPGALRHLRERGLSSVDVRAIPAAAGGPKGLILNPLDRFLFGDWLVDGAQPVHLLGASIGAWRMATACLPEPDRAFSRMADDYIRQSYEHEPGKPPKAVHVSEVFGAKLAERFGGHESEVLNHPRFRLHVFTSRGRHLLSREGKLRTPLGYLGAFATNAVSRKAMGGWLERVVFSDTRDPLPIHLRDFRTHLVPLEARNLQPSILASCSIPFWLQAVHDIPGGPRGAYWDGGITDYHLRLNYASMDEGLVLYPHFQKTVIPGWLDKALRHRHHATAHLDNVIVLSPRPQWIATLPNAKLPDRSDFKRYGDDLAARVADWSRAVAESERLAEEFSRWLEDPARIAPEPLG
ncbi:phospholipase [uncultured Piscinibacter sp.]|uniref:patatin-like phospholipase family protein n=1 Tax=uncultured Piscinibacter sp. TaxID=1131835 RepID=UPI002638B1E7|nr:phospholipase [uncultured Piscinibacter sp.]